jgi:hypothetical protein
VSGRVDAEVAHWRGEVSRAAAGFESRWTDLALRRISPSVAQALLEQRGLFDQACVIGGPDEVETHGAAMCRGLAVAVKAMEASGVEDDAYQLGSDPVSGCRVAIGQQRAAVDRVRQVHGQDVIWITPDEVATLMASVEAFKFVGAVKQLFPGAEIIKRYADAGT